MVRTRIAAVASAALMVAVCAATASAAKLPRATLTTQEYKELSAMYAGLLNTENADNWTALTAACEEAGSSTPLLATQRSSCVAAISTLSYIEVVSSAQKKCATALAARSGAKSSVNQDLSALQTISCLNSDYQQLGRLAADSYAQDVSARQKALARGFSGVCLATLVDTPPQLQAEQQFASAAERLAAESGRITGLPVHHETPTAADIAQFATDSKEFGVAFEAMAKLSGPTKLSVCPHQ